jgi:undecaprenyl-diphosphatase
MGHLTLAQALTIGVAQAFAIIPGVSRSGSTITAGLFMNLKREAAARFSFLLGTPVIVGAGVKKAYDISKTGIPAGDQMAFFVGFLVAAVSGYFAIFFLLRFLQRNSTLPFIVYRVIIGLGLIALVLIGFRR